MNLNETIKLACEDYKAGNLKKAADIFFTILDSQPEDVDALLHLAAICSELNNHEFAMRCIDAVNKSNKQEHVLNSLFESVEKNTSRDTISLCMIVKNEEDNLIKCLIHARPISSELIIVDTGSTDRTKDIALAFGARVFDFPWTNNFSDARNLSLSKATGKWILVLDADEVISFVDHDLLKELVRTSCANPVAFHFILRTYLISMKVGWTANDGSYREEAGTGWFPTFTVRLFPNDFRIRFENPVHELVYNSLAKERIIIKDCDIPIHHYGYLSSVRNFEKGEEYYRLGIKKLDENKYNIVALDELADQAVALGKYEEALEYWKKVIEINPNSVKAFHCMGNAYFQLSKYADASSSLKKALELVPDAKETIILHASCDICLGHIEPAMLFLKGLYSKYSTCPLTIVMLAISYFCEGRKEEGLEIMNKQKNMKFFYANFITEFAIKLLSAQKIDYAILLLKAAVSSDCVNNDTSKLLTEICKYKFSEKNE
jgi:glycosyltransferase involved in cell wall biosynthesis